MSDEQNSDGTPDPTAADAGPIGLEVDTSVEATREDLKAIAEELQEHVDDEVTAEGEVNGS